MRTRTLILVALAIASLTACGSSSATAENDTTPEPVAHDDPPAEPPADPEPEPEPVQTPAVADQPVTPVTPPPTPIHASSADEIRAALMRASNDVAALRNLVDPEYGVGTYDAGNTGVLHHCAGDEVTGHPGMGFVVREDDRFSCDRRLRRCTAAAPDGGGYVFHFRDGPNGAIWLNAVIHHQDRVPTTDARAVRDFVEAGDGVCALHRDLVALEAGGPPPQRFSVFVSEQTGLVSELVSDHLCGAEAAAAYNERLAPYLARHPDLSCTRGPARCSMVRGDEEVTIYGDASGLRAVTLTRPGMHAHLERAQRHDLDQFLRGLAGHRCESAAAEGELDL
ncbi:MAG: hypothetical protein AB7S26_07205 [Sandaracinaceae bacterium]